MNNLARAVCAYVASREDADRGASVVEYALLIALIVTVVVSAMGAIGSTTSEQYSETASLVAAS